jgi:OOP family OmpA-OmpF porin
MDRLSFLLLACLVSVCIGSVSYAATTTSNHRFCSLAKSGFYLGAAVGASDTNYKKSAFDNPNTGATIANGAVDNAGFGYRGLVGYKFNKNFAAELGYTKFDRTKGRGLNYNGGPLNQTGHIDEQAVDLTAKGILPVVNKISLYAKLGAAYLFSRTNVINIFTKNRGGVRPWLGAGISFDVTKNFAFDASYNRIQSSGKIKPAEFLGIGFYWYL